MWNLVRNHIVGFLMSWFIGERGKSDQIFFFLECQNDPSFQTKGADIGRAD